MRHLQTSQFPKHITISITNLPGEGGREGGRDGVAAGFKVSTEHKTQNTQQKCKTFTTRQHRKWKTLIKSDLCFFLFSFFLRGPLHWHFSRVCHHPTFKKAASSSSSS
jgi:hypothetical protein